MRIQTFTVPGVRFDLQKKRDLLSYIHEHAGPLGLLNIGKAIDIMDDEPTLIALRLAKSPLDLLDRWRRLEKFVHSRHFIEWRCLQDGTIWYTHKSRTRQSPTTEEDLLVLGVIIALMDGIAGVQVRVMDKAQKGTAYHLGLWQHHSEYNKIRAWIIAFDVSALPQERYQREKPCAGVSIVERVRAMIAADPCCRWSVSNLADALRMGKRSLQRQLSATGTSFSSLMKEVRINQSARMLCHSTISLAEIGYTCGYSD